MKKPFFFIVGLLLPILCLAQPAPIHNKITLIDFWATWCTPCVQKLPALQALQQQFRYDVRVLLVNSIDTRDTDPRIRQVLQAHQISLPSITQDSVLLQRYPHRMVPHYVWLAADGSLLGTSTADLVNATTVRRLLHHQPVAFNETIVSTELYRSTLTSFQPGQPNQVGVDTSATGYRFFTTNTPALQLYQLFYPEFRRFPDFRIRFDDGDRDAFISGSQEPNAWDRLHTYCYELVLPRAQQRDSLRYLRADLDRFFGWRFSVRREPTRCWVLRAAGDVRFTHDTTQAAGAALLTAGDGPKYLREMPLSYLVDYLNVVSVTPVVDQSGYTGLITFDLPADCRDPAVLRPLLRTHGLLLTSETLPLDYLHIQNH